MVAPYFLTVVLSSSIVHHKMPLFDVVFSILLVDFYFQNLSKVGKIENRIRRTEGWGRSREEDDTIVIAVGRYVVIIHHNDLGKRIADTTERTCLLGAFGGIGNRPCGLQVTTITPAIDHEIDLA